MAGNNHLTLPHSKHQQHHQRFLLSCALPPCEPTPALLSRHHLLRPFSSRSSLKEFTRFSLFYTHKACLSSLQHQFPSVGHTALLPSHHHQFSSVAHKAFLPSKHHQVPSAAQKALPSHRHEFSSFVHRSRAGPQHGRSGHCLTVCQTKGSMEESPLGDGPLEPLRPGFSRLPHSSLSFIPVDDPAAALPSPAKVKIRTRRGRRSWKKPTPAQAMAGAVVGGLWAALALKGTTLACEHLDSHPLARNLPMGLTNNVNQLLLTIVTGLGGFTVIMFGVSSFGLTLLTLKLLAAPKSPLQ